MATVALRRVEDTEVMPAMAWAMDTAGPLRKEVLEVLLWILVLGQLL